VRELGKPVDGGGESLALEAGEALELGDGVLKGEKDFGSVGRLGLPYVPAPRTRGGCSEVRNCFVGSPVGESSGKSSSADAVVVWICVLEGAKDVFGIGSIENV